MSHHPGHQEGHWLELVQARLDCLGRPREPVRPVEKLVDVSLFFAELVVMVAHESSHLAMPGIWLVAAYS